MARKRMVDPEIWTDERFAMLSEGEQLFFIAIFTRADDEGRLEWSALQFKLRCAPASTHSQHVFEDRKNAVVASGLAFEYTINGRVYLLLPGWFKTQKLERGAKSETPDPDDLSTNPRLSDYASALEVVRGWQRNRLSNSDGQRMSEDVRECPLEGKGREEKRREEKRREEKERSGSREALAPDPFPESVEPDVLAFVANAAAENKSGKITAGRESSLRRELSEIRLAFGDEVFRAALRETNSKGVPNTNYVKRVAESSQRRPVSVPAPRLIHAYSDGRRVEFVRGSADEPKSWSDTPTVGMKKRDVWPEHRHLVFGDEDVA